MKKMCSAGLDITYAPMLKEVCSEKKVNITQFTLVRLMYLPDSTHLPTSTLVRYSQVF